MTLPTADVSVRVAWSADAAAIAAVQVATWRETYAGLLPPEVVESLDAEQFADQWARSLDKPADARNRVLVALERNDVRGFAVTGPCTDPDADAVVDGEIAELVVAADVRGQGHGSRLLQASVDTLRQDRFTRAVMWLRVGDDASRRFLTEAGWASDGAHRELDLDGTGAVRVKQVRLHAALS